MDDPTDRPRGGARGRDLDHDRSSARRGSCVSYSKPRFTDHPYQLRWDTIGHSIRMRSIARRARRGVIPAHSNITMSALLASSFVGRVAAFKATKVQVRFFVCVFVRHARLGRGRRRDRAKTKTWTMRNARWSVGRGGSTARVRDACETRETTRETVVGRRRAWEMGRAFASRPISRARLHARELGRG